MCVPLKLCGRCTYMLKVAMVCCTPPLLSLTTTGWRILLMPTLLIASWRASALFCTSAMGKTEFMANSLTEKCWADYTPIPDNYCQAILINRSFSNGTGNTGRIQAAIRQHLGGVALLQELVRQPQVQQGHVEAMARQAFGNRAARATLY